MNERVGFIKALWGSCCGTGIFPRLRRNSYVRTLLHLFLISVLCAGFIATAQSIRAARQIREFANWFEHSFGGIRVDENGMFPEKNPETAREVPLYATGEGKMFYFPAIPEGGIVLPEQELVLMNHAFIWTPRRTIALGRLSGADDWKCMDLPVGQTLLMPGSMKTMTNSALTQYLAGLQNPTGTLPHLAGKTERLSWNQMAPVAVGVVAVFLLIGNFLKVFLLSLLYTGVFVLTFRLGGGNRWKAFTLGEFWRIGIYAGFPVMLIASCFPAFELPFLQYGMVYMIGLVIYWLVIASWMERSGIEGGESSNE